MHFKQKNGKNIKKNAADKAISFLCFVKASSLSKIAKKNYTLQIFFLNNTLERKMLPAAILHSQNELQIFSFFPNDFFFLLFSL